MNISSFVSVSEQTVNDLAHFAWCALVALHTARLEGQARSPLTTHTFLLSWLARAQKQRRFPRTVASDIDRLLRSARQKGPATGLQQQLEYIWYVCTGPADGQSELFLLTQIIEQLKTDGWINAVVTDEEWGQEKLMAEFEGESALLVRKSELMRNFSHQGVMLAPVNFLVTGDMAAVTGLLDATGLYYDIPERPHNRSRLVLTPVTAFD
ncbi:DUF2913 family protein [Trabulsiella odontotermitis]|uniref:DUF2913 family protein n=1 Tax=Trabulsiella odontotermitis TaxID=379893 RepID=UPI0012D8450E|nr:DUF2913 family protein [Trabulsiella odontotermitis]